jgi:hypothetical protein
VGIHQSRIMTTDLRQAYSYLLGRGELSQEFDVIEVGPTPKRSVYFKYAGRSTRPFALIVNSGERKDYHLFYVRKSKLGNEELALAKFGEAPVSQNRAQEITIQIRNQSDAEKAWKLIDEIRLK